MLVTDKPRVAWRLPLWAEITLVLLVKVVILTLLWNAFFSKPQTKHMRLPTEKVEQQLLSKTDSNNSKKLPGPAMQIKDTLENQPELREKNGSH